MPERGNLGPVMKMKRRFLRAAAATAAAALLLIPLPRANAVSVSAEHAILLDATSGRVLYEKDADARSLIASTTKIMTALVVCEQCNVLDRVKIVPEAVGIEGSSMYLKAGEVLTIQELLYGLMLQSGNDAAVALAIYCGGTVEGFAQLMNDEARRIGLENTHFENPNGLDSEEHYSTARDLAKLAAYAMGNEVFAKTVSTKTVRVGDRSLSNHNKLLWQYPGADGVKTGFTKAAGRILVSSATQNGRRLIAVTINAPDDWNDHARLLDMGFQQYAMQQIVQQEQVLGQVEVISGTIGRVDLVAAKDFSYPIGEGEQIEIQLSGTGFAYAPVEAGKPAGLAHILVDGVPVGKVPLLWGETVEIPEEPEKKNWFQRILGGS